MCQDCRCIGLAWFIIIMWAIPAMFSHGETVYVEEFPDKYEIQTVKCVFLAHEGYNHPLFQVSIALRVSLKLA